MTIIRKVTWILLSMLAIAILPWLGSYLLHEGSFPEGFYNYPPLTFVEKAPFSPLIFGICCFCFLGMILLYSFPKYFGFKKYEDTVTEEKIKVKYPLWYWIGVVSWGLAMYLLYVKSTEPKWLLHWSDIPLFWGFTLIVDGWVYKRNNGKSLISSIPQEIIGIGVASVVGWMLFEYLNFFVDEDWYYPKGDIIDREQFLLYAIVISSGLLPLAFEWYCLFKTIKSLKHRFTLGKKIVFKTWLKNVLLVFALVSLFGAGYLPDYFFWALWLSPALLLAIVLDKINVWTPLTAIGQGNWTPTLLFALTYFVEGLFLEGQNYFSAVRDGQNVLFTEAPAYWQYNLPYVNDFRLFEMPIVGFLGYLPFGVYCWVWWIACAYLLNIPSKFFKENPLQDL